ncbi:sensor histidine kinase [Pseudactinotalea sp.]|uniref:sensor histidine kinase n=1 Tax=Pseudactinotalea sp. TaxID=1926260 RepID=UPI003B3A2005
MTTMPRYPGRPRAALVVAVAAALPAVAGALLQLASRTPVSPDVLFLVVDVMVGLVYGAVAAVILLRRSHPVAWLVAIAAIGGGLAALGGGWASFTLSHPGAPGGAAAIGLFGSAWVPGTLALFLVVPWLVRERPLDPTARLGTAVGILTTMALTTQRLLAPEADNSGLLLAVVVVGLGTAAAVFWRHRRGPAAERAGLGLLAAGTALMAVSFLPLLLVPYTDAGVVLLVPISHLACQALFPGALLVTMLRNRLWGIDLAVSRAVLAGMLTLGLVMVYAALVWVATSLVGSSTLAQVVAAVGVVLAVQPVRRRLETRVHRLVYGEATSAGRAALRVGASLTSSEHVELLHQLATAVGEALRLESVTLTVSGENAIGRWGTPSSTPILREVRQGDDPAGPVLGVLTVTPPPGELLDRRTLDALESLRPVLAVGLGLVRATAEVVRARDAATHARLAERRLIRRELHDGIGPWLSGLRLGLQGARNALRTDPEGADAVLAALQHEVAQRVQDVRLLSRSLLPPVLEERGLAAALTELVSRHAELGFAVEVRGLPVRDPDALRGLDPRVAAAAYAVVSESVLNASRHAGVPGCLVKVEFSEADGGRGLLLVHCEDEGVGRAVEAADGVGTRSMRERAQELGGDLDIGPGAGGGTVVRATLPVEPGVVPV